MSAIIGQAECAYCGKAIERDESRFVVELEGETLQFHARYEWEAYQAEREPLHPSFTQRRGGKKK
ncbi:MAG: hypothetical protein M3P51_02355 [Chloroflexota bacterium]|nr:hypothetical protein [Chloroflexota bacterium]